MPRKMRVEYEGALYHVMSRGDRREDIFLAGKDDERERFVAELEIPPVDSAQEAVQVQIVKDAK